MVQTKRVGFMDNPNRLNVAITRAKFQLLVFGKHDYFLNQSDSDDLKELARNMTLDKGERL
jgi:superfamily I DNA and/or RNA helicase